MEIIKTYKTKANLAIQLRTVRVADAQKVLDLKLNYLKDTTTIPLYDDEYTNDTVAETALINKFVNQENSFMAVAEYEGELIGNIDLTGNQRKKMFHTAVIGMGVKKAWQGKGIGTFLMDYAMEWVSQNPHVEIVWLEVYASNLAGVKLYKKFDFQESGRMKNFFRENDKKIDNIRMVRYF